jgi:hypothetical protein
VPSHRQSKHLPCRIIDDIVTLTRSSLSFRHRRHVRVRVTTVSAWPWPQRGLFDYGEAAP